MGGLFNIDNPFFTALGKLVDLLLVSILWLICCIPVITIIPATASLYYTVVKVIRRDRGYITREFFHAFKLNFKTGTLSGIIITAVIGILLLDRYYTRAMEGNFAVILFSIFNALIILVILGTLYISPVLSRFSMNIKNLFKTSFFMALRHLPTTIIIAALTVLALLGAYILPFITLIVPAVWCLLCSFFMEKVLKKYMPEKSEDAEARGVDEWYLE